MADIVNGGAIVLVAAFGLVALVGAADEFSQRAGPPSGPDEPEAVPASAQADPSTAPDIGKGPGKRLLDDDRGGKDGRDDRGRDRGDRGHDDAGGDDGDDEGEEEEDD